MSEVVSFNGGAVPETREPRKDTIAALEEVLERARSGEVQGVALATFNADGTTGRDVSGIFSQAIISELQILGTWIAIKELEHD